MFQHNTLPASARTLILKAFGSLVAVILCYKAFSSYHRGELHDLINHASNNVSITLLHYHGGSECLPQFDSSLIVKESDFLRRSCQQVSPYSLPRVRIGTVTAHFGEPQDHYQKALQTHLLHSLVHDTQLEVMCSPVMDDSAWNKPAFILSLLLVELMKPAEERLEWLFWVDRDTLILDQCRPISSFLPPDALHDHPYGGRRADETKHDTHLIVTKDWNGLNAGIFLVRVNQWAIEFFSNILAFRDYNPNVTLEFAEQSAMEIVMKEPKFQRHVEDVPWVWFNAYPGDSPAEFEERDSEEGLEDHHARRGDFLLHFAGREDKDKVIVEWVEMLRRTKGLWQPERILRNANENIQSFWAQLGHDAD
ncbi:galactosyl transferase GMA12/MNN10 family-domain-containing protein [Ilyonectria sp. MPI-CAGE-AT-0026]|nr:galactosyl transferase GMA12/MNN10 family-domain-containing protein [Ilyonectria sp. MPI-CAGE-AT-0026]